MDKRGKWVEGILASVDQRTQNLLEELGSKIQAAMIVVEATWQEFKAQLAEIEAQAGRCFGRNTVMGADKVKPRFSV
jgi:hypothetical protein